MIWWCICIFPCICTCHKKKYIYIHTHIIQRKVTRWVASTDFLGILTLKIGEHEQFDLYFSTRLEKKQSRPFDLNVKGVEGYNIEVPWGSCLLNWIWLRRMCCFNTLWTVSLFDGVSASIRWWNILKSVSIWHTSQNTTGLLCAWFAIRDLWGDFALYIMPAMYRNSLGHTMPTLAIIKHVSTHVLTMGVCASLLFDRLFQTHRL